MALLTVQKFIEMYRLWMGQCFLYVLFNNKVHNFFIKKEKCKQNMVVHNFNPSIYEAETDSFSYIVNLRRCYMRHCLNKTVHPVWSTQGWTEGTMVFNSLN